MDSVTDDLVQFKAWFRADREHSAEWRRNAIEDFNFLASEQYTEQEKADLKAQLRPIITFNRTHSIINAVSGMEISNRQEVKYFPREEGDAKANELLTEGAKWFRDQADADDEDSDAFLDSTVCGMGWTETTMDYENEDEGVPVMSAVNPLEMYWDKSARKKNLVDANRLWRVRDIPISRALEMFPDTEISDLDAKWAQVDRAGEDPDESQEEADRYEGESDHAAMRDDRAVTIVQLQYKKRTTVYMVENASREMSAAEFKTLKDRAAILGMTVRYSKRQKTVIRNVFIGSKVLRPEADALCKDHFSFQCVTAYQDRVKGTFFGLMKLMKDPQRWANKWMAQALHILNSNAKGGLMMEKGATDDIRRFETDWARPDKIAVLNDGALSSNMVKEKPQAQMPASFFQMMQFAIDAVRDVPGVSLELLGQADRGQASSLEFQRRQSGMTILAPLFDNLKRYRRGHGKLMLYIIQNYLNDGRLVRIVGEAGAQYVPLAMRSDIKYDIVVDDQINSPDAKLMVWQMLTPFLGMLPPQVQLALVDYAPLPTSVIEKIKQAAGEAQQAAQNAPNPEQVKAEAEIEGIKAATQMKVIEGKAKERELSMQMQQDQVNVAVSREEAAARLREIAAKADADASKAQTDAFLGAQKIRLAEIALQQAAVNLAAAKAAPNTSSGER